MTRTSRRVVATAVPFGAVDRAPRKLLASADVELVQNPLGRKPRPDEVLALVAGFSAIIAGTEHYGADTLNALPNLKAICRVGIGVDSIDLVAARRRGIIVTHTPDGPSPAVAELTVGMIVDLLRGVGASDRSVRNGGWHRIVGLRVATSTVGIIGVGRIGRRVVGHLQGGFPGVRVLAYDIKPDRNLAGVEWVDLDALYRLSDVVSLHLPLTTATRSLITTREFALMKPGAVLVNTARGGIVNEADLISALTAGHLRAAALDVFSEEPYRGPLATLQNVLLTSHIGSLAEDCRAAMEIEATREAIRILDGKPPHTPVPEEEYANAAQA